MFCGRCDFISNNRRIKLCMRLDDGESAKCKVWFAEKLGHTGKILRFHVPFSSDLNRISLTSVFLIYRSHEQFWIPRRNPISKEWSFKSTMVGGEKKELNYSTTNGNIGARRDKQQKTERTNLLHFGKIHNYYVILRSVGETKVGKCEVKTVANS